MRRLVLLVLLSAGGFLAKAQNEDQMLVMFWNLENFFDWTDQGTGDSDTEFSLNGNRHWTSKRFYSKCDAIAKTIFHLGDECGRLPDVIGLAEIENRGVLEKLCASTLLRKCGYSIVHFDSEDRRGIDVAFIYRNSHHELLSSSLKTPEIDGYKLPTRDMLHICLRHRKSGNIYDYIVCHHPSKYGGSEVSQARRMAAMTSLAGLCDSLGSTPKIVMGDFNDVPSAVQFDKLSGRLLNKSSKLYSRGLGTIRYKGKWELIDMFMVDESLDSLSTMNIVRIPFLMTYDRTFPGEKPLRTFSGPKYIGGVSDHCPIILKILLPLRAFKVTYLQN